MTVTMNEDKSVFENENYTVMVVTEHDDDRMIQGVEQDGTDYLDYYEVVNNITGVVEMRTPYLPKALTIAEQFGLSLEKEHHTFLRVMEEKDGGLDQDVAERMQESLFEH